MGKVIVQTETTKNPITLMGYESAVCVDANITDTERNHKRGLDCIQSMHGRVEEFPQVFIELNDYSAKVIRELYTHIAGGPTRLQASTRYIDYEHGFTYVTPHTVEANAEAKEVFDNIMKAIQNGMLKLDGLGIPREDSSMVLPMGMTTKIVMRTNLRHLIDMSRQRMCSRAYWEYRELFADILDALREYSPEWKELIDDVKVFMPKCDALGYCPEKKSCGRMPGKQG